ncbi:hypothetical protein ACI2IY_19095 [Lysobacter enzymogenes]|uniref:hypothetical protein n=1 Tax=Lysobacter enzymogenes TaxID=69 RepID=UPI00384E55E8
MKTVGIACLLAALSSMPAASASAMDLSGYPCTVFNAYACFRLPNGTSLRYDVPSDFEVYEVRKDTRLIASLYFGTAPMRLPAGQSVAEKNVEGSVLRVARRRATDGERLEVFIHMRAAAGSVIHISAPIGSNETPELEELFSGLRPCRPIKSGGQRCPASGAWSKELLALLRP